MTPDPESWPRPKELLHVGLVLRIPASESDALVHGIERLVADLGGTFVYCQRVRTGTKLRIVAEPPAVGPSSSPPADGGVDR